MDDLPSHPDDWLILAGDITDGPKRLEGCFRQVAGKFRQVVWVPGNHELWSLPRDPGGLRGVALYQSLVEVARKSGVLTPEDPYPIMEHDRGPLLIAPLFLLYDYSFRPDQVPLDQVVQWAREAKSTCADEGLLHPDPFANRPAWCAVRCQETEARLAACPEDVPKVLINHFPLEERLAVLPRVPRFTPWCGTRLTQGWHRRFNACAAVYGHLHIRGTRWLDGVPFQEVSLGYPDQWNQKLGIGAYLREVTVAPARSATEQPA